MIRFIKNELKKIQKVLNPCYPECLESQKEDEEMMEGDDDEQRKRSSSEALLKIIVLFLKKMNQEELAEHLQSSKMIIKISIFNQITEKQLSKMVDATHFVKTNCLNIY